MFDDVVGHGWQLLLLRSQAGPAPSWTRRSRTSCARFAAWSPDFGPQGDTVDLDGAYAAWFDRLGVEAVLVRPDLYVFGTSRALGSSAPWSPPPAVWSNPPSNPLCWRSDTGGAGRARHPGG